MFKNFYLSKIPSDYQGVGKNVRENDEEIILALSSDSVLISTVQSTITLPNSRDGHKITIKAVQGSTILASGNDTIDGQSSLILEENNSVILVRCCSTWYVISKY
jgi:hypothetical protein